MNISKKIYSLNDHSTPQPLKRRINRIRIKTSLKLCEQFTRHSLDVAHTAQSGIKSFFAPESNAT